MSNAAAAEDPPTASEDPPTAKAEAPDPPAKAKRAKMDHHNKPRHRSNQGNHKSLKALSHALSWALRHQALQLKLDIGLDGYVPVQQLLECRHAKFCQPNHQQPKWTWEDIQAVVQTNDKQRFSLTQRDHVWYIRANQGHSLPPGTIDPNLLLTQLTAPQVQALPVVVHGTFAEPWTTSIRHEGLHRRKRHHIHLAQGVPGDDHGVISGMRKTCTVWIYLNAPQCVEDGMVFYQSDNGVILTEGIDGWVAPKYFAKVTDANGKTLLD